MLLFIDCIELNTKAMVLTQNDSVEESSGGKNSRNLSSKPI